MRTPDHGKLFPWRFVKVNDRQAYAALLERAFLAANPDARAAQVEAAIAGAHQAPTLVILLYAPQESAKIPEWEQMLSAGAVGMKLSAPRFAKAANALPAYSILAARGSRWKNGRALNLQPW
jgi:nitroreductase